MTWSPVTPQSITDHYRSQVSNALLRELWRPVAEQQCPICGGAARRVRRRLIDRVFSAFRPLNRYQCRTMGCGWRGNLPAPGRPPIDGSIGWQ